VITGRNKERAAEAVAAIKAATDNENVHFAVADLASQQVTSVSSLPDVHLASRL